MQKLYYVLHEIIELKLMMFFIFVNLYHYLLQSNCKAIFSNVEIYFVKFVKLIRNICLIVIYLQDVRSRRI